MINVVVIGAAGRMGCRLVSNIAANPNLNLVGAIEYAQSPKLGEDAGTVAGIGAVNVPVSADINAVFAAVKVDVVINFATTGAVEYAALAAQHNAASVIGVTAMSQEEKAALKQLCDNGARMVVTGNMSMGVNLLFKLVQEAASVLGEDFNVEIVEMHHNQKLDAPSGTAVQLGEAVYRGRNWNYDEVVIPGRSGKVGKRPLHEIGMHALRGGDVVGDHTVIFAANGERLELTHKASSRMTFAGGAVRAALWLAGKTSGLYNMQDVLGLR